VDLEFNRVVLGSDRVQIKFECLDVRRVVGKADIRVEKQGHQESHPNHEGDSTVAEPPLRFINLAGVLDEELIRVLCTRICHCACGVVSPELVLRVFKCDRVLPHELVQSVAHGIWHATISLSVIHAQVNHA